MNSNPGITQSFRDQQFIPKVQEEILVQIALKIMFVYRLLEHYPIKIDHIKLLVKLEAICRRPIQVYRQHDNS